jgi:excisionase family DNA binding protein
MVFMIERLLTYEELAREIGLPLRSLRTLTYKGIIPHVRLGHRTVRFQASRVQKALQKREVKEI